MMKKIGKLMREYEIVKIRNEHRIFAGALALSVTAANHDSWLLLIAALLMDVVLYVVVASYHDIALKLENK